MSHFKGGTCAHRFTGSEIEVIFWVQATASSGTSELMFGPRKNLPLRARSMAHMDQNAAMSHLDVSYNRVYTPFGFCLEPLQTGTEPQQKPFGKERVVQRFWKRPATAKGDSMGRWGTSGKWSVSLGITPQAMGISLRSVGWLTRLTITTYLTYNASFSAKNPRFSVWEVSNLNSLHPQSLGYASNPSPLE